MKYYIFLLFFAIISMNLAFAQEGKKFRPKEKIAQLEKVKIIELLNMDEETSVRFFSRHNEYKRKIEEIHNQIEERISIIEELIESGNQTSGAEYKKQLNEYWKLETELTAERKRFYDSLAGLLTDEQISKLVIFERRFREELRHILMRERFKKNR